MNQILFGLSGRASRRTYWIVNLSVTAVAAVLAYLFAGFFDPGLHGLARSETAAFATPFWLLIIAATLATTARRAHDRNLSELWVLPFVVVPGVLDILSTAFVQKDTIVEYALTFAVVMLSLWGVVELGFRRGTAGPNRYGPDPLAAG